MESTYAELPGRPRLRNLTGVRAGTCGVPDGRYRGTFIDGDSGRQN